MNTQDSSNRGSFLASIGLTLPTLIQIISLGAVVVAQWTIMNRDLGALQRENIQLRIDLNAVIVRLYAEERETATDNVEFRGVERELQDLRNRLDRRSDANSSERGYYVDRPPSGQSGRTPGE